MNSISIVATLLLAVSVALAVTSHRYIQNRVIAPGQVTDLIASSGSKGATTYKIVASFSDKNGRAQVYRSSFSSSSPGFKVGDPIRICYQEGDPSNCGIYSFGYRFGAAWVIGIVALALIAISLGFRRGPALMDAIYLSRPGVVELR